MNDLISRQAAIEVIERNAYRHTYIDQIVDIIKELPSAQEKPFNLPEIYIAEGYDTIEGEDGNVGFGVYVPDETKIYVAGDVEGEIRARALFHEVCHWVQAMCGRPFDEDEANEFSDIVYDALPSAQETHEERTETHACDLIDRQAAQTELMMKCERYTLARESHGMGHVEWSSDLISVADAMDAIRGLPSAQPEQRYTEEELRVFAHGISLSLLSKRSAQYWRYDEDTATEIKFLERLHDKVVADMGDEQDE